MARCQGHKKKKKAQWAAPNTSSPAGAGTAEPPPPACADPAEPRESGAKAQAKAVVPPPRASANGAESSAGAAAGLFPNFPPWRPILKPPFMGPGDKYGEGPIAGLESMPKFLAWAATLAQSLQWPAGASKGAIDCVCRALATQVAPAVAHPLCGG